MRRRSGGTAAPVRPQLHELVDPHHDVAALQRDVEVADVVLRIFRFLPAGGLLDREMRRISHRRDGLGQPTIAKAMLCGRVHPDGTPVDPNTYDYRRAALDALHFAKLIDRLIQNLRRAVGYKVQYFAAVEPQHRLAPHLHAALRGAMPHKLIRQVVKATYHQLWWPPHDKPVYVDVLPQWDEHAQAFLDPDTGEVLRTFDEALTDLDEDPEARPAHVLRFGNRMDTQGLIATQADAGRRVRYLTKYLTKSISEGNGDPEHMTTRQRQHLERLHDEVRWLPCSERCWNWLRYGIQPLGAERGMQPGCCPNKAHDADHLGCGGRRVLVSRKWTRKTLADHKADRAAVVAEVLDSAGMSTPDVSAGDHRPDQRTAAMARAVPGSSRTRRT